jgi:tRNA (adenine22-N1)-methyltransferase
MKLSHRLTSLCQSIHTNAFQHIWDCCCDHGYLGQQLMQDHPESQIHFVDVVPHLIDQVTVDLNKQPLLNGVTHCLDAAAIKLDGTQTHLVVIAGVGGDLLIEMVTSIVNNHAELMLNGQLDFILCPVRQLHKVRSGLNKANLGLVAEKLVLENHLFYEVIHVNNQSDTPISLVGNMMWDLSNPEHVSYQQTMIRHFEKQPNDEARQLLALYKGIL